VPEQTTNYFTVRGQGFGYKPKKSVASEGGNRNHQETHIFHSHHEERRGQYEGCSTLKERFEVRTFSPSLTDFVIFFLSVIFCKLESKNDMIEKKCFVCIDDVGKRLPQNSKESVWTTTCHKKWGSVFTFRIPPGRGGDLSSILVLFLLLHPR